MKKGYKFLMAVAAVASLAACNKDGDAIVTGAAGRFGDNEITFDTSTTRSNQVVDLAALQGGNAGFVVYSTKSNSPTSFWMSGLNYGYDTGSSKWITSGNAQLWSDESSDYPMKFYAFYPKEAAIAAASSAATLTTDVTVGAANGAAAQPDQLDMLYAYNDVDAKPVGGTLPLEFNHILSRVNLDVVVGTGAEVYLQSVEFAGLKNKNTYDLLAKSWGTTPTDALSGSETENRYLYVKSLGSSMMKLDGTNKMTATYPDLLLMPHSLSSWDKSTTVKDGRVEMIYRTTSNANDHIGFAAAGSYPAYDKYSASANETKPAKDKPLLVKVGFPMTSVDKDASNNIAWNAGTHYLYTVKLGGSDSNGGYYVDENYYDEDGNRTCFPIDYDNSGKPEIGDPVLTGDICFDVTVKDWPSKPTSVPMN